MYKKFFLSALFLATLCTGVAQAESLKGYVGLGLSEGGVNGYCKDLYAYHPSTNKWEEKADFPAAPRHRAVAFKYQNKGYVGFGLTPGYWDKQKRQRVYGSYQKDIYQYDPVKDQWKHYTDFKGSKRSKPTAVTIHNKVYIGLGDKGTGGAHYSDLHAFQVASKKWEALPLFPRIQSEKHAFTIHNRLYVVVGACLKHKAAIYLYQSKKKKWRKITELPNPAHMPDCVFVMGKKVFVGLGRIFTKQNPDGARKMTDLFYSYDVEKRSWDKIASFPGDTRNDTSTFVIDNHAYVGLGYNQHFTYTAAFFRYDDQNNTWHRVADFPGKIRGGGIAFTCP